MVHSQKSNKNARRTHEVGGLSFIAMTHEEVSGFLGCARHFMSHSDYGVVFFSPLFCEPAGEFGLRSAEPLEPVPPLPLVSLTGWLLPPLLSLVFCGICSSCLVTFDHMQT